MSTVSYVLNGGPRRVKPQLQEQVLAAVRELDYRPSRIARSMVTGRTGAIGILHRAIQYSPSGDSFIQAALAGVAAEAQTLRHDLLIYTNALTDEPESALRDVDDGRADGWIVISPGRDDRLVDSLAGLSKPMVIITGMPRDGVPYLACDNARAVEAIFEHLTGLGHTKIGQIYGDFDLLDARERHETVLRLIKDSGLRYEPKWHQGGRFSPSHAEVWAERILKSEDRPTALIVANDAMAINVILRAQRMGFHVPGDVSVVGFDGTFSSQLANPPLTTASQPFQAIGAGAVRNLDSLLRGESVPTILRFPAELVVRGSSASPKEDYRELKEGVYPH